MNLGKCNPEDTVRKLNVHKTFSERLIKFSGLYITLKLSFSGLCITLKL